MFLIVAAHAGADVVEVLAETEQPVTTEVAVVKQELDEQDTIAFVTVTTEHGEDEELGGGSSGSLSGGGGNRGLITGAGGNFGMSIWRLHIPKGQTVCVFMLAFDAMNEVFGASGMPTMQPKSPQPPPHPNMEQPPSHEKMPHVQNILRGPVTLVGFNARK
jgi:hypothetical protein